MLYIGLEPMTYSAAGVTLRSNELMPRFRV